MVKVGTPKHEPVPIGDVATPAFVRLPDPASLFSARAQRFRKLAEDHDLKPYLLFLAGLCDAQHNLQDGLPPPDLPEASALARARESPCRPAVATFSPIPSSN
jgi:FdhE protein